MTAGEDGRERFRAWWAAARVHTLPAGVSPVLVGTAIAHDAGVFSAPPAVAALVGAVLIQLGTNLANDYQDAARGVDAPDRAGFTRVTASGMIAPESVKRAAAGAFVAAIAVGTYLVYVGGLPIVVVGLSSVLFGVLYSGGPRPFGYRGLGDLFVFVYFGVVAVVGTYYVQAADRLADPLSLGVPPGTVTAEAAVAGLAMAGLTTAILVVNNVRDIEEDRAAGKRTLAVIVGRRWSVVEFVGLHLLAYAVPAWFVVERNRPGAALAYLTLPLAGFVTWTLVTRDDGAALNRTLTNAGRLTLLYALAFAVGLVMPP